MRDRRLFAGRWWLLAAACVLVAAVAVAVRFVRQSASRLPEPATLVEAAERGDATALAKMLDRGADANGADSVGWTALHWAAYRGSTEMVYVLLRHGAHVNARAQPVNTGTMAISDMIHPAWYEAPLKTPLFAAAAKGHASVIRVLLAHEADINARDDWGGTPLHRAAGEGETRAAEALLEAGADVDALDSYQRTPLCWAVDRDGTSRWSTPFRWDRHETVESTRVVVLLLLRGANPNVSDRNGGTPLHWAAERGNADIARALLAKGAKVDATMDSVKWVARPAGGKSTGGPGQTPLHIAARTGDAAFVALLLAAGADPNKATTGSARIRDFRSDIGTVPAGTTPLHIASLMGNADAVRALLDGGANPNLRDAEDKLPADRAHESRVGDLLKTRPPSRH